MNAPRAAIDQSIAPKSIQTRTRTRSLRTVPPDVVRAAIARALRGQATSASLGSLTLLPHQQDAVSRLRIILKDMRVALLADDVGHGKTYVALAVAREYARVQIIAPAALIGMWRTAVARTQTSNCEWHSVHSFSRKSANVALAVASSTESPRAVPQSARTLFIIDEAHHLRTPTTQRFRAVANVVSGHDVLLLSATPIHNSPDDLRALLGLVLGARANRLSAALLSRVIVRRSQDVGGPSVNEHPPTPVPHDPAILNAILALPAPLPAHDGAVAGALIRMGLLRAWCSSDAALAHALRQRVLRGEALRQALMSNRHPTAAEMRSWLVGDHEVQLAFPELMAQHTPASGTLLEVLDAHVRAVQQVILDHRLGATGDRARARILKDLLTQHPGTPIIAFSQFAETVRAIGRALSDIAGVGVLTGQRAWIASGVITRAEALDRFAPLAQGKPPPREHQRIRLLLTTDLLAEGVNLQDAGVVVHLDLPWTDALRAQRVGRCVRMGSPHVTVHVHAFAPHDGAELVLRMHDRMRGKARGAARLVGVPRERKAHTASSMTLATQASQSARSAADIATVLHRIVATWSVQESVAATERRLDSEAAPACDVECPSVATVTASVHGFIAVVSVPTFREASLRPDSGALPKAMRVGKHQALPTIVCGRSINDAVAGVSRWTVGTSMRLFHSLADHADPLVSAQTRVARESPDLKISNENWTRIERHLRLWAQRRLARSTIGLHALPLRGSSDSMPSVVHAKALAVIAGGVAKLSVASRAASRAHIQSAAEMIGAVRGAGAERALVQWMAERSAMSFCEWLMHWRTFAVLARGGDRHCATSSTDLLIAPSSTPSSTQSSTPSATPTERYSQRQLRIHYVLALIPP